MQFEQQLSAPIKSIDEIVRVSEDTGREYHVAKLESTLSKTTLTISGKITIDADIVAIHGINNLIGKKVKRYVRIDAD